MALSPATQALLDTAIQSHADALSAGTAEKDAAAAAALAVQADDTAKATALSAAQKANVDLKAALDAITAELS